MNITLLQEIVQDCGQLVFGVGKKGDRAPEEKGDDQFGQHYSTIADRKSLERCRELLDHHKCKIPLVAEEQENQPKLPDPCLVFDPVDGTNNFFNWRMKLGLAAFGVTMCYIANGKPQASATFFPAEGLLITAQRGKGCYRGALETGKRIQAIQWHGHIDKAQIGFDVGPWTHAQHTFDTVLKPISEHYNILSVMCAIMGGRLVLAGQFVAYVNLGIAKVWDGAAMALAIEEAGGFVCDQHGKPMVWDKVPTDLVMAISQAVAEKTVLEYTRKWPGRKK